MSGAPGAGSDLDIFIRDTAGNVVASGTNANAGADPIEVVTVSNNGSIDANGDGIPDTQFDIQIELASGPAPTLIKYIALVNGALGNFTQNEWDTQSSTIYGHMNTATGLTVGASRYQNTPAFGTAPPVINAFSSPGPTQIFFDVNGNAVGPIIRNKPDVVGPDGANNTFFGGDSDGDGNPNFSGTSAATPHVAAVGALLLEAAGGVGSLPPAQIFNDLRSTAIDMDDPLTPGFDAGFDFRTGFGLVDALEAIHLYLNAPPVADAGADQTIECTGPTGATVTLDGSGSFDPEDDPITYTWKLGDDVIAGPTSNAIVQVVLPLGSYELTLAVEDDGGETDSDTVSISVEDTTPPTITVHSESASFWPPNHAYRSISLASLDVDVADVCDVTLSADDLLFTGASSDEEEDAQGGGDGATLRDIVVAGDCSYIDLRAERLASFNGRVYTLDIKAADASGNVGAAVYKVHVPRDFNVSPLAIDDGPRYVVSEPACEPGAVGGAVAENRNDDAPQDGDAAATLPESYALHANYPNPFNPSTTLRFRLPEDAFVRLAVYDVLGREVARILDGEVAAGNHSVLFDASRLPSGIYIYRIESARFHSSRSMILLK